MPANCNRYDVKTTSCLGCENKYFLLTDKTCKKFDNCLEFDSTN